MHSACTPTALLRYAAAAATGGNAISESPSFILYHCQSILFIPCHGTEYQPAQFARNLASIHLNDISCPNSLERLLLISLMAAKSHFYSSRRQCTQSFSLVIFQKRCTFIDRIPSLVVLPISIQALFPQVRNIFQPGTAGIWQHWQLEYSCFLHTQSLLCRGGTDCSCAAHTASNSTHRVIHMHFFFSAMLILKGSWLSRQFAPYVSSVLNISTESGNASTHSRTS